MSAPGRLACRVDPDTGRVGCLDDLSDLGPEVGTADAVLTDIDLPEQCVVDDPSHLVVLLGIQPWYVSQQLDGSQDRIGAESDLFGGVGEVLGQPKSVGQELVESCADLGFWQGAVRLRDR
ncbi:MAG: hypothetical protein ACRCYU_07580 [Nocardioides sp.]